MTSALEQHWFNLRSCTEIFYRGAQVIEVDLSASTSFQAVCVPLGVRFEMWKKSQCNRHGRQLPVFKVGQPKKRGELQLRSRVANLCGAHLPQGLVTRNCICIHISSFEYWTQRRNAWG